MNFNFKKLTGTTIDRINRLLIGLIYSNIGCREINNTGLPAGRRILILSPHIDDEILGAGGAFCLHKKRGDHLACVYLTDGSKGYHPALKGETYIAARKNEAEMIGRIAGYEQIHFLDYPDFTLKRDEELCRKLANIVDEFKPDLVYLPFFLDPHPDHVQVTNVLLGALAYADGKADYSICAYGVYAPLTPWVANCLVDISDVYEVKLDMLNLLQSQVMDFSPILDFNAYNAFLKKGAVRVELLLRLGLPAYRRLYEKFGRLSIIGMHSRYKYLFALLRNARIYKKLRGVLVETE